MLTILPTMVNPSILELRQNLVKGAIISYDLDTFDNSVAKSEPEISTSVSIIPTSPTSSRARLS